MSQKLKHFVAQIYLNMIILKRINAYQNQGAENDIENINNIKSTTNERGDFIWQIPKSP